MGFRMSDAKISVSLDVEPAEDRLDQIEKRLKEDAEKLKKVAKEEKNKSNRQGRSAKKGKGKLRKMGARVKKETRSVIPYAGIVAAGAAVIEYGGERLVDVFDEGMKASMPGGAYFKDMREGIVEDMKDGLKKVVDKVSEFKGWVDGNMRAKDAIVDIVRSSTGLGLPVDETFLVSHYQNMFKIGQMQSELRDNVKRATLKNMGASIEATFKKAAGG